MNKRLIYKMVQNCLKQYNEECHSILFESREFAEIFNKVIEEKNKEADSELHEIVNDVIYGYITGSPYF
ncbi:YqzH-like protein [Cytobacillus firmus]|uniref:YqzH-like protein n=2 Tax=Cytobacillus TaxID=2675230 RepID=A0A366JQG1_CYTFI|nr:MULTISPECIES: YqzH family protein [Cytobacillus]RBP89493.1 YqzH-like protein [Cytobacillus firmus]TDX47280.1 YqzH-like protein [Cytobacillus oceanisediminis]